MKLKEMLIGVILFKHALERHELYGVEWDERMIMNPKLDNCSWFIENTMIIAHSSWEIMEINPVVEGHKNKIWKHVCKTLNKNGEKISYGNK